MEYKKDRINVSVRIRPVLSQDSTNSSSLQIISKEPPVLLAVERSQPYHFDKIFSEDVDQEKVYDEAVRPFVECVKKGYNCTVFTYGQTGTGKTYTMGSGSQNTNDHYHMGIIPRALEQLFDEDHFNSDEEIDICVSFSEIYNEKVFDLLQPDKKFPMSVSGFAIQGLNIKNVSNVAEAHELLDLGNKTRHVGETRQNISSSRSHAIFTVYFTLKNSYKEISGKLNLVDLAGSESVRKTGSKGSTFQEGININKGLLSIGLVISALSMKSSHIPYRQSMITSILQGSLNVDNYISLIACVSGNPEDITETLQTLDFAQRAKKVRSNPEVNQIIAKFQKEHSTGLSSGRTPLKRSYFTPMKTPAVKRVALPLLPLINESSQSQASNVDSSKSQISMNISGVSSRISPTSHMTQQALSPVIRKYVTKMEVSIIDRLETVIKSTLRRPTRASLLAEKTRDIDKENTPNLRWSKLQNEVSKMVRSEMAQMTVDPVRATSSPIEEQDKLAVRRLLRYDSSPSESAKSTPQDVCDIETQFKVPQLPPEKKKRRRPSQISLSPIENEMPKLTPRRSTRLSLRKANCSVMSNSTLNASEVSFESSLVDRGPKANYFELENGTLCETCVSKRHEEEMSDDSIDIGPNCNGKSGRRQSSRLAKKKKIAHCYRSPATVRNKRQSLGLKIAKTPAKVLVERALKKSKTKDSPYTSHSKKVLNILNQGSHKELERLQMIGAKSAEQILLYRKLKGQFSELEDLSKMPGWGVKKYNKFVTQNFLKKD